MIYYEESQELYKTVQSKLSATQHFLYCPIQLLGFTLDVLNWWFGPASGLWAGIRFVPTWSSWKSLTATGHTLLHSRPPEMVLGARLSIVEYEGWDSALTLSEVPLKLQVHGWATVLIQLTYSQQPLAWKRHSVAHLAFSWDSTRPEVFTHVLLDNPLNHGGCWGY